MLRENLDFFTGTLTECKAYITKMDLMLGYPNLATKTTTYAKPKRNFTVKDEWLVPIKAVYDHNKKRKAAIEEMESVLAVEEKANKEKWSKLKTDGSFDDPDKIGI